MDDRELDARLTGIENALRLIISSLKLEDSEAEEEEIDEEELPKEPKVKTVSSEPIEDVAIAIPQ